MLVYTVALLVFLLDQWSKWMIRHHLPIGQSIILVPPVLDFTHVENPGAAWSIFPNQSWLFEVVALAVLVGVIITERTMRRQRRVLRLCLGLLLGGALGNLVDRMRFNRVTDFIHVNLFHYPVFNIADSAIVVAVILLIIDALFSRKPPQGGEEVHDE